MSLPNRSLLRGLCFVWVLSLGMGGAGSLFAQTTGGGGGQEGMAVKGGTTEGGNRGGTGAAGVYVDADGVLQSAVRPDKSGLLKKRREQALAAAKKKGQGFLVDPGNRDFEQPTPWRLVSLPRLEAACREFADAGKSVPVELEYLAGLQRIDAVFALPETGEILVAGPAEGVAVDPWGRGVGVTSGRAALRLEDLVVLLRSASGDEMGCSIDPDPARLADLQRFLSTNNGPSTASAVKSRFDRMDDVLGLQHVRTFGVPADSHVAAVLVEADYVMKRVGLGIDQPPVKGFRSHLAMLGPGANTMQRWWFTPLYEPFTATEDRLAWNFAGPRVQLSAEHEIVDGAGRRSAAGGTTPITTEKYAKQFNEKFDALAAVVPSFAEMRGVFDLALVAALIRREGWSEKCGWPMSLFKDEAKMTVSRRNVPRQVKSLVNYKNANGSLFIGLVGGGVTFHALATLETGRGERRPERGGLDDRARPSDAKPGEAKPGEPRESEETIRARLAVRRTNAKPPEERERWWWDTPVE